MATNFEAITKNPETLAAFLRALPILEGPWDEEFQRNYCAGCGKVSCDDGILKRRSVTRADVDNIGGIVEL